MFFFNYLYRIVFLFLAIFLNNNWTILAQSGQVPGDLYPKTSASKNQVTFIENIGQITDQLGKLRSDVLFMGKSNQSQLLISNWGYSHQLYKAEITAEGIHETHYENDPKLTDSIHFARVDLRWIGSNKDIKFEKLNPTSCKYNYYNLPYNKDGISDIQEFESVRIVNIYPGINVRFYDADGLFEHDYELAPGADYRNIQIQISGTDARLNKQGELVLHTSLGTVAESSPVVFQDGKKLQSNWVKLDNNLWGFEVPDANTQSAMIIDPISRVWGTYFGGSNLDEILYSKFDTWGNLYVMGGSQSINNIATSGTHQTTIGGSLDAFLAKFDEDGNQLWGTYIGGSNQEELWACDFDADGNIYATGRTDSNNNISTPGSHQTTYGGGGFDAFLQKFNSDGMRIWGTYYGGEEYDRGRYCHVDAAGFLYMAGVTKSFSNISTAGSHQEVYGGAGQNDQDDAMLIKFTLDGERIWGTYYGGIQWEEGYSCDTDSDLNVYLYGHAQSPTNISTAGSHQQNHGGGLWDSFLVKFSPAGTREWGTYIGGSNQDLSWTCSIDTEDNIYITGRTSSFNGISTSGTHQTSNGGDFDAYVMKFSGQGEQLWGTYFGGPEYERGFGCQTIENGKVLISGHTESSTGIAIPGVHQELFGGGIDAFLALFNQDGNLEWSTYYGGAQNEVGRSTTYFNDAYYLAGWTLSNTNISTSGIHQENYGGGRDGFIVKFSNQCATTFSEINIDVCSEYEAPDGNVYAESGIYTATILNAAECDSIITINLTIQGSLENDIQLYVCEEESVVLPDGTEVSEDGNYPINYVTESGCDSVVNYEVVFNSNYLLNNVLLLCSNEPFFDHLGNEITTNGTYTFVYQSSHGCDSVVVTEITFINGFETFVDTVICAGNAYTTPSGTIITEGGTYSFLYQAINGCDSVVHISIEVLPNPVANFSASPESPTSIFNSSVDFFNQSTNADSIFWDFGEFGTHFVENPTINFGNNSGVHLICLTAVDSFGCQDELCLSYSVLDDFAVYIPNSFTPNGDGINDLFFVDGYGIDPDDFLMRVFNRWGEVIFESNDLYKKWDGAERARTHYAQNEVYTYQVILGALNNTTRKEFIGRVTAIR